MSLIAVDFAPTPDKLQIILDHCVEHRPWYSDYTWSDDPVARRATARQYLAELVVTGKLWEVWSLSPPALKGIIFINRVVERTDACCHFIFFDRKLSDKRALCLGIMDWCFTKLDLHRLSVEIPTYARALANFARKLGFRYEAEGRTPYTHKDEKLEPLGLAKAYIGSRRFQSSLYQGQWHDVLLLSLLREEFEHVRASQINRQILPHTSAPAPAG